MRISELGEDAFLEKLRDWLPAMARQTTTAETGIGDDAAVLFDKSGKPELLMSCDLLIQGHHFTLETISPEFLGRKSLAVNISDIAAMGGIPRCAVISLGLPGDTDLEFLDRFYKAANGIASEFGMRIVGGDTTASPVLVIDVAILGDIPEGTAPRLRSGAEPGQQIAVTGTLGDSGAGLDIILKNTDYRNEDLKFLVERHFNPTPRVRAGQVIAANEPGAMCDLSDGLSLDLSRICRASGCGAVVDAGKIPLGSQLIHYADNDLNKALNFALNSGEDYELLFTASPEDMQEIAGQLSGTGGVGCTVIGEVIPESNKVIIRDSDGREYPLSVAGFDHFKNR